MSFVDNAEIKTALVAELKEKTTITSRLPSVDEIRETQYQGTDFSYPNVRVRIINNEPIGNTGCYHRVSFGVQVFSQKDSSKEAEEISGIIAEELNDKGFTQNNVSFFVRITNLVPALRTDERTWKTEALFIATVS